MRRQFSDAQAPEEVPYGQRQTQHYQHGISIEALALMAFHVASRLIISVLIQRTPYRSY